MSGCTTADTTAQVIYLSRTKKFFVGWFLRMLQKPYSTNLIQSVYIVHTE